MAGFSMNKVLGTIKKRPTFGGNGGSGSAADNAPIDPANDTPENIASRSAKQFCQSVGSSSGDDVIFLPLIVEAAVASPAAAAEAARVIRKYLHRDYWSKPSYQYNAIMLIRILADNPGPGFTRYMDKKFVDATKDLLRSGRDPSVRQLLMETLDSFETSKALDEGLGPTIEMWKKEKEKAYRAYGGTSVAPVPPPNMMQPFNPYQQAHHSLPHHRPVHAKPLPDPVELANRLEEARTSAKLLEQVVACTPPSEVLSNELIKEFSDRCSSASRSIQGYMAADSPGPDNDTMESLIDTNEQLQQALNHHRRAVLQAKKQLHGADSPASESSPAPQLPPVAEETRPPVSPPVPARRAGGSDFGGSGFGGGGLGISSGKGKASLDPYNAAAAATAASPIAGPSRSGNGTPRHDDTDDDGQDPFRDPPTETAAHYHASGSSSSRPVGGASDTQQRLSFEPFHPGFGGSASAGGAGGSSSAARGAEKGKTEPVTPVSDEGGSDVYGATPRVDDHVYRY